MEMLRERRKALGLSQAALAELIGVHQTAVSQWECGGTEPRASHVLRLAAVLGCDPTALLESVANETGRTN